MRRSALLIAALLTGWFCYWAWPGLRAYFAADDMMNLHFGVRQTWAEHARDNILFYKGALRPLGNAFYKGGFTLFGLNPLGYRVLCFFLLLLNVGVSYAVAKRITGSEPASFLAALAISYFAPLAGIFYSTATVFDILAYLFFFSAFWVASSHRSVVLCAALFVCALNSKENAVILPVVIAGYEWFCQSQRRWKWTIVTAAIAAIWVAGKLLASYVMTSNPAYTPSLGRLGEASVHYLNFLTGFAWQWTPGSAALLAASLVAVAWLSKTAALRWAAVLIFAGTLPVMTIELRSFYVLYLPCLGLAIYLSALIAKLPKPWWAVAVSALLLIPLHRWATPRMMNDVNASQQIARQALEPIQAQNLDLVNHKRVLFLEDPFPHDDWILTFVLRLQARDENLVVDRVKQMERPPTAAEIQSYDYVFRYSDGRLVRER